MNSYTSQIKVVSLKDLGASLGDIREQISNLEYKYYHGEPEVLKELSPLYKKMWDLTNAYAEMKRNLE